MKRTAIDKQIGFSIVLCTFNGKDRLKETLSYVASLEVPASNAVELLLIDNASTDGTGSFVKETWLELGSPFPLSIILESRSGKGYAIETGYDAANLSRIISLDDDNWLDSDYLVKACELFEKYPDVSILQGISRGVFESSPPDWIKDPKIAKQFVIGGAFQFSGYFPQNYFYVWGAGLILHTSDWVSLRQLDLSFLCSKLPGKAAGEDSELGLGLILLGKKAYYSTSLKYQHYMPTGRMTWEKLRQNHETLGHVNYYMSLYSIVICNYQQGKVLTAFAAQRQLTAMWLTHVRLLTPKQHVAYWAKPQEEYYQLMLAENYSRLKWIAKLSGNVMQDVQAIQAWVVPLLERSKVGFEWP